MFNNKTLKKTLNLKKKLVYRNIYGITFKSFLKSLMNSKDPDPEGRLITDPPDSYPQHGF